MSIYKKFCTEVLDGNGGLKEFSLNYPENFNFAYDVVDAIAEKEPDRKAQTAFCWSPNTAMRSWALQLYGFSFSMPGYR